MAYFSRQDWGAAPPKSTQGWPQGKPDSTTLHWVGAPLTKKDDYRSTVRSIQQHAFSKGLSDIDYNFLVAWNGDVYEGRGWSVRSGAHHVGNPTSLAVCYLEAVVPLPEAAARAIEGLALKVGGPIHPHNYWNQFTTKFVTSCPGPQLTSWCDGPHGVKPAVLPKKRKGKRMQFIVSQPDLNVWFVTDGLRKRPLGTGEAQTLVDLGLVEPERDAKGDIVPKYVPSDVFGRIKNA